MEESTEAAAIRMMLRMKTPELKKIFEMIGKAWNEPLKDLYATFHYESGADLDDPKNVISLFHSTETGRTEKAFQDSKMQISEETREMLNQAFPALAMLMFEKAEEWKMSVYNLFMLMRYKAGTHNMEDPDSIELQIRTKKSVRPEKSALVS